MQRDQTQFTEGYHITKKKVYERDKYNLCTTEAKGARRSKTTEESHHGLATFSTPPVENLSITLGGISSKGNTHSPPATS